jgi:hypothetical protein
VRVYDMATEGTIMQPENLPVPPSDSSGLMNWVLGILASALAAMWKIREGENSKKIKSLEDAVASCAEEHKKSTREIIELTSEVGYMKGRLEEIEQKIA